MNIFLTGCTGFLGGEILMLLSKNEEVEKICCLVRANGKKEAITRIKEEFDLHSDFFPADKIVPVVGDLLDSTLSKKLSAIEEIKDVDTVIHAAADTHFAISKFMEKVNVGGTKSILNWAVTLKNLRTFAYVGTATICGKEIQHRKVVEDESPNPSVEHMVKYTKTKMLAEMEVRKIIPSDKLLVVRPSSIMGDSRNLKPRDFDILWALIAVNEIRLIPADSDSCIDMLGVDYVADAIQRLLFSNRKYNTYHISSGYESATSLRKLTEAVKKLDQAKRPEFHFLRSADMTRLKQWAKLIHRKKAIQGADGVEEYIKYWRSNFGDNGNFRITLNCMEDYLRFANQDIVFDNSRLLADTNIGLPVPAHEYVSRMWPYMKEIDVIEWALKS